MADLWAFALGVRQDKYTGDPLDGLERQRSLLLEFLAAAFAPGRQFCVPGLGLG